MSICPPVCTLIYKCIILLVFIRTMCRKIAGCIQRKNIQLFFNRPQSITVDTGEILLYEPTLPYASGFGYLSQVTSAWLAVFLVSIFSISEECCNEQGKICGKKSNLFHHFCPITVCDQFHKLCISNNKKTISIINLPFYT